MRGHLMRIIGFYLPSNLFSLYIAFIPCDNEWSRVAAGGVLQLRPDKHAGQDHQGKQHFILNSAKMCSSHSFQIFNVFINWRLRYHNLVYLLSQSKNNARHSVGKRFHWLMFCTHRMSAINGFKYSHLSFIRSFNYRKAVFVCALSK